MRLSACLPMAPAISAAYPDERIEDRVRVSILDLSLESGLDIFINSREYSRLNKLEISQASGFSSSE